MACINNTTSSLIFLSDLPSYGLIGLTTIGLIIYISYIIIYMRNDNSSKTVYIHISQLSIFFALISSTIFVIRPSASINLICPIQMLSLQIFPYLILLGYNVHFIHQWLLRTIKFSNQNICLISLSSFLIFFLSLLIQTAILLIWFSKYYSLQPNSIPCTDECYRPLFLCSLSFNFFLLFVYSLQSSIRHHIYNTKVDFIYLLTSLLSISVTIMWICLYLFLPLRSLLKFYMNNNYILSYGNTFFVLTFLGPFLYEQLFYSKTNRLVEHKNKSNKMTFRCLSLTKEQQRAFMAAYIKRNLTASSENLTATTIASPMSIVRHNNQKSSQTCHSTLSVDSLCPTMASIISSDSPVKSLPTTAKHDTSNYETMTSEYLFSINSGSF